MKKTLIAIALFLSSLFYYSCQGCSRELKTFGAEFTGLERTAVLIDYNGDTIKKWEGKFIVNSDNGSSVYFDYEGKRVLISGGIFISEEKYK